MSSWRLWRFKGHVPHLSCWSTVHYGKRFSEEILVRKSFSNWTVDQHQDFGTGPLVFLFLSHISLRWSGRRKKSCQLRSSGSYMELRPFCRQTNPRFMLSISNRISCSTTSYRSTNMSMKIMCHSNGNSVRHHHLIPSSLDQVIELNL